MNRSSMTKWVVVGLAVACLGGFALLSRNIQRSLGPTRSAAATNPGAASRRAGSHETETGNATKLATVDVLVGRVAESMADATLSPSESSLPAAEVTGYTKYQDINLWPITDTINSVPVIAVVTVVGLEEPRFNTASGTKPLTGSPDTDPAGFRVFQPMLLRVDQFLKVSIQYSATEGFVVSREGGTVGGYSVEVNPSLNLQTNGDQGIVFLLPYLEDWLDYGTTIRSETAVLRNLADRQISQGIQYSPMSDRDAYLFQGATAVNMLSGEERPISELRDQIEAVLSQP